MASRAVEFTDSWWLVDDAPDVGYDGWVEVVLRFDDSSPFEVTMMYEGADGTGVWHQFSRDLLGAGLGSHAGHGLVQVWPADDTGIYVAITDQTDGETWCFIAPRPHIEGFMRETLRLVPRGQESWHLDVPDDVAELLEGSDG